MPDQNSPRITVRMDRTRIDSRKDSFAHVVVEVRTPVTETNTHAPPSPLNLGIVIDASGSMSEGERSVGFDERFGRTRLEAAQRAASEVVGQLADYDVISVVSFASETLTHVAALKLDAETRATAIAAIGNFDTRGCTNLSDGWLRGAEHVARYAQEHEGVRNRVLLLSDGWANEGVTEPDILASTAAGLRSRGISTSSVGIGLDYSTEQLEVLAEHGGGMMHHAANAEDIVAVILAEMRDMQAAVIENVEVTLRPASRSGWAGRSRASSPTAAGFPAVAISSPGCESSTAAPSGRWGSMPGKRSPWAP